MKENYEACDAIMNGSFILFMIQYNFLLVDREQYVPLVSIQLETKSERKKERERGKTSTHHDDAFLSAILKCLHLPG